MLTGLERGIFNYNKNLIVPYFFSGRVLGEYERHDYFNVGHH